MPSLFRHIPCPTSTLQRWESSVKWWWPSGEMDQVCRFCGLWVISAVVDAFWWAFASCKWSSYIGVTTSLVTGRNLHTRIGQKVHLPT